MSWTVLICEGGHDQAALAAFARICGGWEKVPGIPNSLPRFIADAYPTPLKNRSGGFQYVPDPEYLHQNGCYLEIRALGGVTKVLGNQAALLLTNIDPDAVGVVVDANSIGVTSRVDAFRNRFSPLYEHAGLAEPGIVCGDHPRLGLWIAPDNESEGQFDRLLIRAAERSTPELLECGNEFTAAGKRIGHGPSDDDVAKATLGAIHQFVLPGASLATAIQRSDCWFDEELIGEPPFDELKQFLDHLTLCNIEPSESDR